LGKWASGAYVISSPVTDIDDAIEQNIRAEKEED
jgi:hypothetical protein